MASPFIRLIGASSPAKYTLTVRTILGTYPASLRALTTSASDISSFARRSAVIGTWSKLIDRITAARTIDNIWLMCHCPAMSAIGSIAVRLVPGSDTSLPYSENGVKNGRTSIYRGQLISIQKQFVNLAGNESIVILQWDDGNCGKLTTGDGCALTSESKTVY